MPSLVRPSQRLTRRLAIVGAVTAGLLVPSGTATAGGPTSVLLVSPTTGATASYTTDADYHVLEQALGTDPTPDSGAPDWNAGPGHEQINITWLVHDVAVWRTDHVVTSMKGGPWIQTRTSFDGSIGFDEPGIWHRAAEPKLLLHLLGTLGVLDEKAAGVKSPTSTTSGVVAVADTATTTSEPAGGGMPGYVWWAVPSLIVGILIGFSGRPLVGWFSSHRRRQHHAGPRQQLVDV